MSLTRFVSPDIQWACLVIITSMLLATNFGKDFSENYFVVEFDPFVSRHDVMYDTYNESEIIFMVAKISTQFTRILMPTITVGNFNSNYSTISLIPVAVAKFNKFHRNQSNPPLELIIPYDSFLLRNPPPVELLSQIIKKANEANDIFPGTIKAFLKDSLNVPRSRRDIDKEIEELVVSKFCVTNNTHNEYKLGVVALKHVCDSSGSSWDTFVKIISHVDLIIIKSPATNYIFEARHGVIETVEIFSKVFDTCTARLVQEIRGIEVWYKTKWSVRTEDEEGVQNATSLALYWNEMNKWAMSSNATIVLASAFDNYLNSFYPDKTIGWWRLIESSSYDSAMDYVFESKHMENGHTVNISEDIGWLDAYFPNDAGLNFNVSNLAVKFNAADFQSLLHPEKVSTINLRRMLQLISKEFSKIAIEISPSQLTQFDTEWKASYVVEEINKVKQAECLVQVLLVLRCDKFCVSRRMKLDFSKRHGIFGQRGMGDHVEAVQTLILSYEDWEREPKHNLTLNHLKVLRQEIMATSSNQSYILGILINLRDCVMSRYILQPQVAHALEHLDMAIFNIVPTSNELAMGVEQSLGGYLRLFKFCKENIHRVKQEVDVGLMITWPDTDQKGTQNIANLVELWGKVKSWAVKTNTTTVIMNEAFDVPFKASTPETTRGWWRLVNNVSLSANDSIYEFEDKKTTLLKKLYDGNTNLETNVSTTNPANTINNQFDIRIILGSVGLGVLILLGLLTSGVAFVYAKFAKRNRNKTSCDLTKQQLDDFFNGGGQQPFELQSGEKSSSSMAASYDTKLECKLKDFSIVETEILGSGQFGIVYRATLKRAHENLDVAAKTTKPDNTVGLKGILAEIKILGYLGPHENIVSIVGAYTAELAYGKVYVFMELCTAGSLKDMLRKMKATTTRVREGIINVQVDDGEYVDHAEFDKFEDSDEEEESRLLTASVSAQLMRWAYEICCGMEFLASKQVVHADLASRNVLLTEAKTAKISDFGLSRNLSTYDSYVKKGKEALPWRWMAPESLKHLEFNEKTDVWAYGITLWEIFSLGEIPYSGWNWCIDFASSLANGLRLENPRYDDKLFPLMQKCWDLDGNARPTFSELKKRLQKLQRD